MTLAGILSGIARKLIGAEIETSVAYIKIQSAIVSLQLIKNVRRLTKIICLLVFSIVILACGLLLIPVSLCLFMPWAPETKAIVAVSFGAAYMVLPLISVLFLFREKLWMKASIGAAVLRELSAKQSVR